MCIYVDCFSNAVRFLLQVYTLYINTNWQTYIRNSQVLICKTNKFPFHCNVICLKYSY